MARFLRCAEEDRTSVQITVDGVPVSVLEADTVLVALMLTKGTARVSQFSDGPRAGFCMMGACQDCWVWTDEGARLRACSTRISAGMSIHTAPPEGTWPSLK